MGAKRPGGKRPGGKRLGGETTRGGNGLGAKRPGLAVKGLVAQCLLIVSGTCTVMRSRSPMRMLTIYYMLPRNML